MIEFLEKYKIYLIALGLILFIGLIFVSYVLLEEEIKEPQLTMTTTVLVVEDFYVDIKGAVLNPGVFQFSYGERVIDAIERAGGLSNNGNTSNINLSQRLTSEMVIYVFTNAQIRDGNRSIDCSTVCENTVLNINNCYPENNTGLININTALVDQLTTLNGIGESRALAIIAHREQNGPFRTIEDIMQISGIGEAIFNNIREKITV